MRVRSQGVHSSNPVIHINVKVFGPLVSVTKALGKTLLKSAGQAVLPKHVSSMRNNALLAKNVSRQASDVGLPASSVDPVAILEEELAVSSDVSEAVPQEEKLLKQHIVGEVRRWHIELFNQPDMRAGRISDDSKTEKAVSLFNELSNVNEFAKANPDVLEHLIKDVVGRMAPAWQMRTVQGHDSAGFVQFGGGYLKATKEEKEDPSSGLPFSLVKTTSGKVYELLNTLNDEAKSALFNQHLLSYESLKGKTARELQKLNCDRYDQGLPPKQLKENQVIMGSGTYGKVRLARDVQTQEIVAVKKFTDKYAVEDAEKETNLINNVQTRADSENPLARPTLSRVLGHAHAEKSYVFMPLMNGGDGETALKQLSALRHEGKYDEADTRFLHIAKGYAEAVKNMHDLGFVHRDIKMGNFMHSWKRVDGVNQAVEDTALIDFGFVGDQRSPKMTYDSGTSMYMPPEVQHLNGPKNKDHYDAKKMDSYSLGMVLLELLKGTTLYKAPLSLNLKTQDGLIRPFFLEKHERNFSSGYKDQPCCAGVPSEKLENLAPNHFENVIAKLLAEKPNKRMTATEAFNLLNTWGQSNDEASTSKAQTRRIVHWADQHGKSLVSEGLTVGSEIQETDPAGVPQTTSAEQAPVLAPAKRKSTFYSKFFVQLKPEVRARTQQTVAQATTAEQAPTQASAAVPAKRKLSLYQSFFPQLKR